MILLAIGAALALVIAAIIAIRQLRGDVLVSSIRRFANLNPSLREVYDRRKRVDQTSFVPAKARSAAISCLEYGVKFPNGYYYYQLWDSRSQEIKDWEALHWSEVEVSSLRRIPSLCSRCGRPLPPNSSFREFKSGLINGETYPSSVTFRSFTLPMCPDTTCLIDEATGFFRLYPGLRTPFESHEKHASDRTSDINSRLKLERVHKDFIAAACKE